jgi:high affinity Mn2+ porin
VRTARHDGGAPATAARALAAPWTLAATILAIGAGAGRAADVEESAAPDLAPDAQTWAIHGQSTVVEQGHPGFHSPYSGPNSLASDANGRETFDLTLYAGFRPWSGAEIWIDPEVDQGFGLSDTLGVAGFPNAEGSKVGSAHPYVRLQRAFLRQTLDLGGGAQRVDPDINQLGGRRTDDRLVFTLGRFSAPDIFDTNDYAHDPKHDFLNWGMVDALTFDYAADAWGYTDGAALEWYQGPWTVRGGLFDLSDVPNSERLDTTFQQFQMIGEIERRYSLGGRAGALKVTGFLTRGRMATFADALALAARTGTTPDVSQVRRYRSRGGVSFNLQQQITGALGLFARGGWADGDVEPYEFSDADRSISGGLSLQGQAWGRRKDTVGLAVSVNGISRIHQQYLAAGGLGILVGDGRLPHPGDETILETYYALPVGRYLAVSADYQFVNNPAYNRDRGPVSIFAARLHAQF